MHGVYTSLSAHLTRDKAFSFLRFMVRKIERALPSQCDAAVRQELFRTLLKCEGFLRDVFRQYVNTYCSTIYKEGVTHISYPLTLAEEADLIHRKIMPHITEVLPPRKSSLQHQLVNQPIL